MKGNSTKYNEFDPYAGADDNEESEGEDEMNETDDVRLGADYYDDDDDDNDDDEDEDDSNNNIRDPNSDDDAGDDDEEYNNRGNGEDPYDDYDEYDEYGSRDDGDGDGDGDGDDSEGNYSGDDRDEMPEDYYYDEEYPDENFYHDEQDEEDRRRRSRLRRAWICCLVLLCCLLVLIIVLIVFLLNREVEEVVKIPTARPTLPPLFSETDDEYFYDDDIILAPGVITMPMAPFNRDCKDSEGVEYAGEFRNIIDQCECNGEISGIPADVVEMRNLIIERVAPKFYGENYTIPLNSCDPPNMAAIWLATADMRDAGEPRQRFAMALSFYQLNGTVWDYMDGWMGPFNECLWMGIQCNNKDAVNSLALDTNNLFGPVRMIRYYMICSDVTTAFVF